VGTSSPATIIEFDNVSKVYDVDGEGRKALDGVTLAIHEGDIYGIIGLSGAGKSTLVRTINGIESVSGGSVRVEGKEIGELRPKELRGLRTRIGMIFQNFNLMPSRTVAGNVEFPLRNSGLSKQERAQRVAELLDLVELSEHSDKFPAELSGGQKQRVAIARALANNPDILLSDEATSALDPLTTEAILALLKNLQAKLGITIVVIAHQMQVIKEICNRVAVLEHGTVVEENDVYSVFANPQADLTKQFIANTSALGQGENTATELASDETLIKMQYVDQNVSESLISTASRQFDVDIDIRFAEVSQIGSRPLGGIIAVIKGSAETREKVIGYFRSRSVNVEVLEASRA
jgi:D-methionine transport system ATP-binding protein